MHSFYFSRGYHTYLRGKLAAIHYHKGDKLMFKNRQRHLNIGKVVFLCAILSLTFATTAYSADRSNWPKQIRLGGGSIGGTMYVGTARFGNMVQEFLKVNATTESSD